MANGWTTPEEAKANQAAYEQMLVERYEAGLPLTNTDKRDARRIMKARKAFARAAAELA